MKRTPHIRDKKPVDKPTRRAAARFGKYAFLNGCLRESGL